MDRSQSDEVYVRVERPRNDFVDKLIIHILLCCRTVSFATGAEKNSAGTAEVTKEVRLPS